MADPLVRAIRKRAAVLDSNERQPRSQRRQHRNVGVLNAERQWTQAADPAACSLA